jgi:multisubunit Na+/H+ antiporter MnhC subunit
MFFLLSFVVGGLFAAGLYLMLRRSIVKLIFGLVLLSHAANLLIFTAGGLVRARPPPSTDTYCHRHQLRGDCLCCRSCSAGLSQCGVG